MINRAKCKLCNTVVESFHLYDLVECKCGEISVGGGDSNLSCAAKSWDNFLRVDDEGNNIVPRILPLGQEQSDEPKKNDLIAILDEMVKDIERMPDHAKAGPVNHYDLMSLILLVAQILKRA